MWMRTGSWQDGTGLALRRGNKISPMTLIARRKIMKHVTIGGAFVLSFIHLSSAAFGGAPMTPGEINAAEFLDVLPEGVSPLTVKLQVLLDRAARVADGSRAMNPLAVPIERFAVHRVQEPVGCRRHCRIRHR